MIYVSATSYLPTLSQLPFTYLYYSSTTVIQFLRNLQMHCYFSWRADKVCIVFPFRVAETNEKSVKRERKQGKKSRVEVPLMGEDLCYLHDRLPLCLFSSLFFLFHSTLALTVQLHRLLAKCILIPKWNSLSSQIFRCQHFADQCV